MCSEKTVSIEDKRLTKLFCKKSTLKHFPHLETMLMKMYISYEIVEHCHNDEVHVLMLLIECITWQEITYMESINLKLVDINIRTN